MRVELPCCHAVYFISRAQPTYTGRVKIGSFIGGKKAVLIEQYSTLVGWMKQKLRHYVNFNCRSNVVGLFSTLKDQSIPITRAFSCPCKKVLFKIIIVIASLCNNDSDEHASGENI